MTEFIGGVEIVKDTPFTRDEYEEITNTLESDFNNVDISLSELTSVINDYHRSAVVLEQMMAIEEDSPYREIMLKDITNHVSLEEIDLNNIDYKKIGKKIFHGLVQTSDIIISEVSNLVSKTKAVITDNTKKSEKISAKILDFVSNHPNDTITIPFKATEAAFFTIDNKFDIAETVALYATLLDIQNKDKAKIKNIESVMRFELPEDNDYDETKYALVPIEISVPFPPLKESSVPNSNLRKYIGPRLPKGYMIAAILPDPSNYRSLDDKDKVEALNNSDVNVVKTDFTNKVQDREVKLDVKALTEINNKQKELREVSKSFLILLEKIEDDLDKLRRHYRGLTFKAKENPTAVIMRAVNDNTAALNFVIRTTQEPITSLNKMALETYRVLLFKLNKELK